MQNMMLRCPFCGAKKAQLIYYNAIYEDVCCVDSDEELDDATISPYVHCYECGVEAYCTMAKTPREVLERWNTRKPLEEIISAFKERILLWDSVSVKDRISADKHIGTWRAAIDIVNRWLKE